jgi:hypothetical protein
MVLDGADASTAGAGGTARVVVSHGTVGVRLLVAGLTPVACAP